MPGKNTFAVAEPCCVESAALVAVIVNEPAEPGAVYMPVVVTVPALTLQVTAVLEVPVTVALNCWVAPVCRATVAGLIVTAIPGVGVGVGDGAVVVTVTVAVSDLEVSA